MTTEKEATLNPEVLDSVLPFSGDATTAQQVIANGGAMQKTETQYTTAVSVQKPRSLARIVANVLQEAKLAGTAFYYRWEVWDKQKGRKVPIQGPSIDLAMCIARNYGNCAIDISMNETATHYIFKGVFVDLETGFTVPRLFRQRKAQNIGGKMDKDRAEDLVFQIGQSKAQRNAIVKAAPGWLVEQAVDEARQAEINKITPENMAVTRAKVLDYFSTYGLTQERIEKQIGRNADTWTAEDIVNLKASATALKEGRTSADELFPEDKEPEPDIKEKLKTQVPPGQTAAETYGQAKPADPLLEPADNPPPQTPEDTAPPEETEAADTKLIGKIRGMKTTGLTAFLTQYHGTDAVPADALRVAAERYEHLTREAWPPKSPENEDNKEQAPLFDGTQKPQEDVDWNGLKICPKIDGNNIPKIKCKDCSERAGCLAWQEEDSTRADAGKETL